MKKIIVFLTAIMMLFCSFNVCAENEKKIIDNDDLLSATEENELEQKISEISKKYSFDIVILTFDNLEGKDIETFTADYFMDNGYGIGEARDGLILSIYCGEDEDIRLFCSAGHGYGEQATGEYFFECLSDESTVVDKLSDNEFYNAFLEYIELADVFLFAYSNGEAYDYWGNDYEAPGVLNTGFSIGEIFLGFFIIIIVSAIVGLIYISVLKSKMNTAVHADSAQSYINENSFNLKRQSDFFIFSNVTRVRIKTESNSRGGGSFKSSGGSSFSGGSGRF